MVSSFIACLLLGVMVSRDAATATPFDRTLEIELHSDDESLIDGHGPAVTAEYEVAFDGTLHVWTRSDLDLVVRVEDVADAASVADDDDSGGGSAPYLCLTVTNGSVLAVSVECAEGSHGRLELHLVAAPETDSTRRAAEAGRLALSEASRLTEEGDLPGARDRLKDAIAALESARGAELSAAYFLSESAAPALRSTVFELTETMRMAAGEAVRSLAGFDTDPELAPILEQADRIRRELNDLVGGDHAGREPREVSAEVTALSLERDRLEREVGRRLADRGVVTQPIVAESIARALRPTDAIVGYRRMPRWYEPDGGGTLYDRVDHLFAHVVRSDGVLERIDLGPAKDLEELAIAWRAALGAPLRRGSAPEPVADADSNGVLEPVALGPTEDREELATPRRAPSEAPLLRGSAPSLVADADAEVRAGRILRERVLEPVLDVAGDDVRRVFVCRRLRLLDSVGGAPHGLVGRSAGR